MTQAEIKAAELVRNNARELDLQRDFSFNKAKSFLEERVKSKSIQHTYRNELDHPVKIVFGSLNNSMFKTAAALLAAVGGHVLVDDGELLDEAGKKVILSSADNNLLIGNLIRFGSNSSTRIVSTLIDARKLDGSESSAFATTTMESVFVSPLEVPDITKMQMAKFLDGNKYNNGIINVDYAANGFPFIISAECFVVMTLPSETILNVTHEVGAMDSAPQRAYRRMVDADVIVRPLIGNTSR